MTLPFFLLQTQFLQSLIYKIINQLNHKSKTNKHDKKIEKQHNENPHINLAEASERADKRLKYKKTTLLR